MAIMLYITGVRGELLTNAAVTLMKRVETRQKYIDIMHILFHIHIYWGKVRHTTNNYW